ncbi:hypothetical protein UB51_06970 [Paenibacillus sp. IHBB 10380]|nr:hypothetical protein UB51_06970 [Paenibacillus sp. IHBB 10380]
MVPHFEKMLYDNALLAMFFRRLSGDGGEIVRRGSGDNPNRHMINYVLFLLIRALDTYFSRKKGGITHLN